MSFLDILIELAFQSVLGLPAVPRESVDWKKRRKNFVKSLVGLIVFIGVIVIVVSLNAYRII